MSKIDDVKMMVQIANMYYIQNMTQVEIANALGFSRSKVFRYLQDCIKNDIVTITVNDPFKTSSQLEAFFKNRFALKDVIIVPSSSSVYDPAQSLKEVGTAAAHYLSSSLVSGCILGVEWGMTAYYVSQSLNPSNIPGIILVQMLGCSYQSQYNTDRVITEFAHKLKTVPFTLPFPVIVENIELVKALRNESRAAQIFGIYKNIDIALLTVGTLGSSSTNYIEGFVSKKEIEKVKAEGAVADVCGRYLDIQGNICGQDLYDRTVSINFDEIRDIELPILVASGEEKAEGIIGALNGGLCKVLITDEYTANQMMKILI